MDIFNRLIVKAKNNKQDCVQKMCIIKNICINFADVEGNFVAKT